MDDSSSGFFGPIAEYSSPDRNTLSLLHESQEGFFSLYRGERAGRFRVYKCLKPEWRDSPIHQAMLQKEFEIAYSLSHPNICQTSALTEIEGLGPCIEMEWIDGATLDKYLERGRPDRHTFLKLAAGLCDAMEYLHKRQIVHRDIKPSNIMVTHDGEVVKIIDFSLADRSASSILKLPAGTLRYTAPEVLQGNPGTIYSDIYSLGAVLAQMAPGRCRVAERCMQKNPLRRYASIADVKAALMPGRVSVWAILAGIAALAAIVVAAVLALRPAARPEPQHEAVPSRPDTVFVKVQEQPKAETPKPKATKQNPDDPDSILREITEMLEEKL